MRHITVGACTPARVAMCYTKLQRCSTAKFKPVTARLVVPVHHAIHTVARYHGQSSMTRVMNRAGRPIATLVHVHAPSAHRLRGVVWRVKTRPGQG